MANLFPVFLSLSGKECLVVGGGQVAERKIADLLECEANINVISPTAGDLIRLWSNQGLINWQAREIEESDLNNIFLAFVATNNMHTNQMVANWCRERGIMVNAVDDPPNCDFYVPAVVRRNSLIVAISTEGKSPMFARRLREQLEELIGEEYGEFVDFLGELREPVKQAVSDIEERKRIFAALADSDILDLLKAGERERAKERMEQCMSSWQD